MSSDNKSPVPAAEEMALDLTTKSCPVATTAPALRCIRSNLYKPRKVSPYMRPKVVRFSIDGAVTSPVKESKSPGCGCETENLPPSPTLKKDYTNTSESSTMVHPAVLQEDRLRELDRLLQRVTQRAAAAQDQKPTPPSLPQDPRNWSREHVHSWLAYMQTTHGLARIPCERFRMNGKALCLMSPSMFSQRVPVGGKLLYKDFRMRLCQAMACV